MADKKITELPYITDITASVGVSPTNTTVIPVVLYGTTNQITADNLKDNFIREVRRTVADVQTYTSSLKGAVTVRGNGIEVAGNLEVQGNMSVKGTVYTQFETSSVLYSSGSTKFGNSFDDLHETTGSVFFTGSHSINGEDYTYYSSSNSSVFTNFSSSNSSAITEFSSSNSTLFTNFSSSNSTYNTTFSSSNSSAFTNFSSSNSSYNTTFSSSNATHITALSSSNSTYNTNLSSSNSTLFTSFSSSNSTLFTSFSSSNSTYNTTFSSSNATYVTSLSSSNSTTFTNYSSSTANSINGLSSGVSSELARVYQTTSSLNIFSGSQDSRNFIISQFTSSTDAHIVGISSFTSSQLAVNLGNSIFTSSARIELNSIEAYTASLKTVAIVSSSTQVQNYDLFALNSNVYNGTGSLQAQLNGLEAYTASLKAAAIVSSSTQISNYYKFAETASANTFYGNQTFNNDVRANKFVFTDSVVATNVGGQNIIGTSGNILYLYTGTSGLYINNSANNAQNVTISDAGVVQTRGKLTVGAPGNDQDIAFGGSQSKLDWAGTGAQIQYSVGALQFSSVGTTNNMILQMNAGALFNAGITGSLMATNGVVSSSQQISNYYKFAETASANTFYGTQSITGSVKISGSIDDISYIDFDLKDNTGAIGRLGWDASEGTLTFGLSGGNVDLPIGVVSFETAFNADSSSISKGDVVRVSGAQGNRVAVKKAHNFGDDASATSLALAGENIGVGAEGKVITKGPLKGIDTTAFGEGDMLYLSTTPGGITNIKPQAPNHDVRIGVAQRISATVGIINVQIQNGYEIDELHDVRITTASLAYNQLLARSGSVWRNETISNLGIAETASLNPVLAYTASLKNAFTLAGNDVNFVGKITAQEIYTTFTTSSVLYQSGSTKFGDDSDDKHAFTGSVKISGSFEVQGTGTGATVGDLLVDSANNYVYVGRQSATSGDNTTLVLRDRTGTARATLPAGGSSDTIFTTNASNFKVTNYSGTSLLNVSNVGNVTASGTFTIGGQTQIGTATTDTSLGSNTKLKVVGDGNVSAGASQGSMFVAAGVTGGDTGLPVNMGTAGASMMLLASINTSTGTSTNAAQYLLQFYFDGNNLPNVMYVTGSSNWATFSVTSNNTLAISGSSSGNKSYAWWINKFGA